MPGKGHLHAPDWQIEAAYEAGIELPLCMLTRQQCDTMRQDWDAMQQVLLAVRVPETKPYRKDKGLFAQLVRVVHGEQEDLVNDEGNPNMGPWPKRLRAALARYRSGDLPEYNLYTPTTGD